MYVSFPSLFVIFISLLLWLNDILAITFWFVFSVFDGSYVIIAFNGADIVNTVPFAFPLTISTWATSPFSLSASTITFCPVESNSQFVNDNSLLEYILFPLCCDAKNICGNTILTFPDDDLSNSLTIFCPLTERFCSLDIEILESTDTSSIWLLSIFRLFIVRCEDNADIFFMLFPVNSNS